MHTTAGNRVESATAAGRPALSPRRKLVGWTFALLSFSLLADAQTTSPPAAGPVIAGTNSLRFGVAAVRPTPRDFHDERLQFTLDGFLARGVTLRELVQEAAAMYEPERVSGCPKWCDRDRFDITAKIDTDDLPAFRQLSLAQRRGMLQALLAERFGLQTHHQVAILPVYELRVAKGGPKLQPSRADDLHLQDIQGYRGLVLRSGPTQFQAEGFSMKALAETLASLAHRVVVDKTGLTGFYNFDLRWTPDDSQQPASEFPSLFAAVKEELGLQLKAATDPVDTLVVDRAEEPTEI